MMMTAKPTVAFMPLRYFLLLVALFFAVAAALSAIYFTQAATATGSSPAVAISLTGQVSSGILGPGQQRWFRIVPQLSQQATQIEKSLTLQFTSANPLPGQYLSLQLFEADQIQFFNPDDPGQMTNFGAGQHVDTASTPHSGQLFWTGWIFSDRTYFIQLKNDSDFTIDYWLSTQQVNPTPPAPEATVAPESVSAAEMPPIGSDPGRPAQLQPGANVAHLQPGASVWYLFIPRDPTTTGQFQDLRLSLYFTPATDSRTRGINFELYTAQQLEAWWQGSQQTAANFGAGMPVSEDGDPATGERIWQGTVLQGDRYYLVIHNPTNLEIDSRLFYGDPPEPVTNLPVEPAPAAGFAAGAAPQTAVPLAGDQNRGNLEPGQEIWYSFSIADQNSGFFEFKHLTLAILPNNSQTVQSVTFEIFTPEGVQTWSLQNREGVTNVGAGSLIYTDKNQLSGERVWSGWLLEESLYYVRVRNGAAVPIEYRLF